MGHLNIYVLSHCLEKKATFRNNRGFWLNLKQALSYDRMPILNARIRNKTSLGEPDIIGPHLKM